MPLHTPLPPMIDPLALVMTVLTLFVGTVVAGFARRYLRADPRRRAFGWQFAALVASVVITVTARNLAVLALGWVASGVLLANLIGLDRTWAEARAAARRARVAFALGDAALLAALVLLGSAAGSADLARVLAAVPAMPAAVIVPAAALLLVAAAVRCALPPFAGWLLSSMTAPTPVSALMHAGLVNGGGFLLIRFAPVMHDAPAVRLAAVALGLVAALHGTGIMLVRPDAKRSLAGSTVAQMGFMIMTCGLGGYAAALWHIVAHGLFKAWLFLGSPSAIGMAPAGKSAGSADKVVPGIALITIVLALAGVARGEASQIPLLLGIATAAGAFGATLASSLRPGHLAATLILGALLIGAHMLGLGLMGTLIGHDGPAILPPPALIALLAAFLALWVWQSRSRRLPIALYVFFMNTGALATPSTGEA